MNRLSKYQWYRRVVGGHWLHSTSCGWFPVTQRSLDEYLREMPRYITAIEDNSRDDAVLYGVLAGTGIVAAVILVGALCWAIPL